MRLDEIDAKILTLLRENARMSFRKIAEKLNLSPMTIVKRVRKLEKEGVIKGYKVLVDKEKVGESCRIFALIKTKPGYDVTEIGKKIAEFEQCVCVSHILGDFDLVVIAECKDRSETSDFVKEFSKIEGIEKINVYFALKSIKCMGF